MNISKFNKLYLKIINEQIKQAYDVYGLAEFKFPKYKFSNVNVGDKLVYVYTSNYGFKGNWQIPYWQINADVVEVTEVLNNAFKLNNNIIVNKANSSSVETYTDTIEVRSGAVDTYDFHTPEKYSTEKQTRKYGKGVYPASFLLKYYDNSKKGYSLIGGGGSYEGINYDSLKELAQSESSIKKIKAKKSENIDQIEPTEKDIQRFLDILNTINIKLYCDNDTTNWKLINDIIDNQHYVALDAFKMFKCLNFYTTLQFDKDALTKAGKMLKLIKDYDKLIRRIKAIPIAFEKFKASNKFLSNPSYFYVNDEKCTLTEEDFPKVDTFKKAARVMYPKNPIIVNRTLANLKIYCKNYALGQLNRLQKDITELYENKLKQLNNILN